MSVCNCGSVLLGISGRRRRHTSHLTHVRVRNSGCLSSNSPLSLTEGCQLVVSIFQHFYLLHNGSTHQTNPSVACRMGALRRYGRCLLELTGTLEDTTMHPSRWRHVKPGPTCPVAFDFSFLCSILPLAHLIVVLFFRIIYLQIHFFLTDYHFLENRNWPIFIFAF